jgi:hypothetical protein
MSTGALIGIVIAVIVVVAVVVVASAEMRRARLRRQFGPEYDRLVEKLGSKRKADAELAERERRVRALNIRELSPEQQASYSGDWAVIQERFVDSPAEAVGAAHTLIGHVMRDRGYPADDRTASMDALSVHNGQAMEDYRKTADVRTETASTEQLRETMIHYRALFEDLTGLREGPSVAARDRVAEIRDRDVNQHAVAGESAPATGTADPGATDRVATDRVATDRVAADGAVAHREAAAEDRELAARNDEIAADNAGRTAYPPR